jgi:Putative prokaryotic signal transducing protein
MIIIYRAANIADAHLIRQMLEAEGIHAFIQGEYLQGAVGELPANTEILVHVGDDDYAAARAVVERWENADVEAIEDDAEDAPQYAASPLSASRGVSVFTVIGCLLFGALAGAAMVWVLYNRPSEGTSVDHDGDGRADERVFFAGERVQRIENDRNRDGKVDQIVRYGFDGTSDMIESDDDFDGGYERVDRFQYNQPQRWAVDHDLDRDIDYRGEYLMGVLFREEWLNPAGNVVKSIVYDNGLPVSGEFDSDGDGRLDTVRRYDRRGEIAASEPLPAK